MRSRYLSLMFFLGFDLIFALLSMCSSLLLAKEEIIPNLITMVSWSLCVMFISYVFKIYNILWRYSGILQYIRIIISGIISTIILFIAQMAIYGKHYDISVYIVSTLLVIVLMIVERIVINKFVKEEEEA